MLRSRLAALTAAIFILGGTPLAVLAAPPANDDPANATLISGLPFSDSVDLAEATDEDPAFPACESSARHRVWYALTPTEAETISVTTGADPSVEMALWTVGADVTDLQLKSCAVDGGDLVVTLAADTDYLVSVGLWSSGPPPFSGTVSFSHVDPPPNDNVAAAIDVSEAHFVDVMSRATALAATFEAGETAPSCRQGEYNNTPHSFWYRVTPTSDTAMSVSLTRLAWLGVYDGATYPGAQEVGCMPENDTLSMTLVAGHTYLLQVGVSILNFFDEMAVVIDLAYPPDNDDFAAATTIDVLPFGSSVNTAYATREPGEPGGCGFGGAHTVWYEFTATEDSSLLLGVSEYVAFVAAYAGPAVDDLTEVICVPGFDSPKTFTAQAGVTYRLQVGTDYDFVFGLQLEVTPPPVARFDFSPFQPSKLDTIQFYDTSFDPARQSWTQRWSFGDGAPSNDPYPTHRYAADGTYRVTLDIETSDGRASSVSYDVVIATHDVAIKRLAVPVSANAGQTRQITVSVVNGGYEETVTVTLWLTTPAGQFYLGDLTKQVPARGANKSTDFAFQYTFTAADAAVGKVTFTAYATLPGVREAYPADNTLSGTTRVGR